MARSRVLFGVLARKRGNEFVRVSPSCRVPEVYRRGVGGGACVNTPDRNTRVSRDHAGIEPKHAPATVGLRVNPQPLTLTSQVAARLLLASVARAAGELGLRSQKRANHTRTLRLTRVSRAYARRREPNTRTLRLTRVSRASSHRSEPTMPVPSGEPG